MRPFVFATDFAELEAAEAARRKALKAAMISVQTLQEECARSRDEGYRAGHADGRRAAHDDEMAHIARLAEKIAGGVAALEQDRDALRLRIGNEAVELARLVASKLAGALTALEAGERIATFIEESLADVPANRDVIVHVHPDRAAHAGEILARHEGAMRIKVKQEPALHPLDCRIAWDEGAMYTDTPALEAQIDALICDHLKRHAPPRGDASRQGGRQQENQKNRPEEPVNRAGKEPGKEDVSDERE